MVVIVVCCHLLEGTFQDRLNLLEVLLLGGDAEIVRIDEAVAVWGKWLVISVDVEEEAGQYAALW